MPEEEFDASGVFDDAYLYFFADRLEEHSDADVDLIWDLLEFEPGMRVLDLACGHGRIANRLAQRGCRVTGLDTTPVFLERARADADARGVSVEFVHGDMRDLPWPGRFDRIVNWLSAFGFFDDSDNRKVLVQAAAALAPGGRFVIETVNYPRLVQDRVTSVVTERERDLVVDRHQLDPLTGRNHINRVVVRDGHTRRVRFFNRLVTFPELRDWLGAAGFPAVDGYGEDGRPLTVEHRRMIAVAH
ncbi:SAM-dependent methyltransferase [Actinophytocola xanthii]|uniref:SAM-dependent methyltransferase n=1 Tax=Actinophytocola xanthii TaxID=1912961 RepID=A0A1Q8CA95_9PSEU|nr:class I SAM-dependent methyltransferase [Actinophytocola xanthii]OLF11297.1 SAM-dependent methyltransferase [Actinophytocola xanthii]